MDNAIRWGVIGCGSVTELKSTPAYQKVPGFTVTTVMGRNEAKVKDYVTRHDIEKYTLHADELINDDNIDAIYIATPPDSHKEYALKVAKAGKPCCIEKPLAPSYQDCCDIVDAFTQRKLVLFVAYYRRSLPRFLKVKSLLEDGAIGDVRHISWLLTKPANEIDLAKKYNWRTDEKIAYGGYFDDLASHGLDLFNYLLGDINQAIGIARNQQGLYSARDAITASWCHESGVTGSGCWNFGSSERADNVEIIGSKGKLAFSIFDEAPIQLITLNGRENFVIDHPKNIQLFHAMNIHQQLVNNIDHPSTGKSASHTTWVMEQILGNNK